MAYGKERDEIYLALEDLDFVWCTSEVTWVIHLWRDGRSIWDIAEIMERDPDEVAILIMDLARKNRITARPVEAVGRRRRECGHENFFQIWRNVCGSES